MEKSKKYRKICFYPETIRQASKLFETKIKGDVIDLAKKLSRIKSGRKKSDDEVIRDEMNLTMKVRIGDEEWQHDSEEEFFADYRKDPSNARYSKSIYGNKFLLYTMDHSSNITVGCEDRSKIESIFAIFEKDIEASNFIKEEPQFQIEEPIIFIGHGNNSMWKDLKDHLHDKHQYQIEAYEVGARAGHAIRDILEDMLEESSLAILVLTGEDETADGRLRARQNVIHETGLFQGRLGFSKAIVVLEEGVEEFSNIHGIEQIRFSKGNIKETFGEVLATIKREFP